MLLEVESGSEPSRTASTRLISAPPSRPDTWIFAPLAPAAIAASHFIFTTRRKLARFTSCSAMARVTGRLAATTPPYADVGSHACALRWASAMSEPTAMPHGLACLMIATAGSLKPNAARTAASVST